MKKRVLGIIFLLVITSVVAANEFGNAGITPDSPFYFLDKTFDFFQSPESLVNERAAEVLAMAENEDEKGLEIALSGYEQALQLQEKKARNNQKKAEQMKAQTIHLIKSLGSKFDSIPDVGKYGVEIALVKSAESMVFSLQELQKLNPDKVEMLSNQTLISLLNGTNQYVIERIEPELENVRKGLRNFTTE
jgi:hypothetical protein